MTSLRQISTTRQVNPIDYIDRWGVVEQWNLDEASGIGVASLSSANNLTDNNTVTTAAGKVYSAARQFTAANSEYLSLADNATLSTGDVDFGATLWVNPTTVSAVMDLITKTGGSAATDEYILRVSAAGVLTLFTGGASYKSVATGAEAIIATSWQFIIWYHDSVNDLLGVSINGGAFSTASTTGVAPNDSGSAFALGASTGPSNPYNGLMGPVAFFKSPPGGIAALATEIRDRLYNSGAGRQFPFR